MSNPWVRFGALTAPGTKMVATVASVNADGSSVVTLRGGGSLRVQGDDVTVGDKVLIQQGRIIGRAASLPAVSVTV